MIALLQRVRQASVSVAGQCVAEISQGLLIFLGVEKNDKHNHADRLSERILSYRVFADSEGKMNLSVTDMHAGLLLVPQFTLAADTRKGARPSFSTAAPPAEGEQLFDYFVNQVRASYDNVAVGRFGADMQVSLINDGPVTFILKNP